MSEQGLLERLIDRIPDEAVVVGDINFGVFTVAYAATQNQHPVVLRMSESRARSLVKREWWMEWTSGFAGGQHPTRSGSTRICLPTPASKGG